MSGGEMELFRQAGSALSAVTVAATSISYRIQSGLAIRREDRDQLKREIAALKRAEISTYLQRLSMHNMNLLFELHEKAEQKNGSPVAYGHAMDIIAETSRLLSDNLAALNRDFK